MGGVLLVKIVIIAFETIANWFDQNYVWGTTSSSPLFPPKVWKLKSAAPRCDMTTNIDLDEGYMGQSSDFNWLGVVQVFLTDGDAMQVAVTGIVLVKANHALASADAIVRIPKRIFQHDTRAMFIPDGDVAVNYSLVSYVTHPEYQTETFNSIAIILLNIGDYDPLVPICFPTASFDTSYLYLTGYTDDYEILGKMIYRIQYIDTPECEEFYEKEGLVVENRQPISYLCGKGHSSAKRCVWDNGMALVSNSSGWFTLIGFSIHGPGCAAPARFFSMIHYSAWIQEVTGDRDEQEKDYDYISPHFRRTDGLESEFIPIHRTFTALRQNDSGAPVADRTWPVGAINKYDYIRWPFPVDMLDHFKIIQSAKHKDTVWITPFNNTFENPEESCSNRDKEQQYAEDFLLNTTPGMTGTVTYEFSLYDLKLVNCSCLTLEVDCTSRSEAYLEFREGMQYVSRYGAPTPEEILHFVVGTERGQQINHTEKRKDPYFRPVSIDSDKVYKWKQSSYYLSIRFNFRSKALLKFKMFSTDNSPAPINKPVLKNSTTDRYLRKKMRYWSSSRPVDKSIRPAALVVDHEVVLDTVSKARGSDITPGVVIIGCLLKSACSTRILFL